MMLRKLQLRSRHDLRHTRFYCSKETKMKHLPIPLLAFAILGFILAGTRAGSAQEVSVGIKGGFVMTNDMKYVSRGDSESDRGEIGPDFELKWASGVALETAVLYR